MADYYPLLAQGLDALSDKSKEMRYILYARARKALIGQLESLDPPLGQSDIDEESASLESAIIRLETEYDNDARADSSNKIENIADAENVDFISSNIKTKIVDSVSPEPILSLDGRLDAGANALFDAPAPDADLVELPIRQNNLLKVISAGLPRNAPKHLGIALKNYSDEITARPSEPILGLLIDMAEIVASDLESKDAREWLDAGMNTALRRFIDNHHSLVENYPKNSEREDLYSSVSVEEDKINANNLARPFESVAQASIAAEKAGLATQDFVVVVEKLTEFAKVVSAQPPRLEEDNSSTKATNISPKKRAVLTGFGFFERVYNILGSTATLTGPPAGNALLTALHNAAASLSKFIN